MDWAGRRFLPIIANSTRHRILLIPVVASLALAALVMPAPPVTDAESEIATRIPVGAAPLNVAVNPTTNRVYVTNLNSNTVTVINGDTNQTIVPPITVDPQPVGVAIDPALNRIYVTSRFADTVTVINGATNMVINPPITVGDFPEGIAVNPTTHLVYVANVMADTISIIDGNTLTVVPPTIAVGDNPAGIAVNPTTNRIYVANRDNFSVSMIDGATSAVLGSPLVLNMNTFGVAVNPATNRVYVTTIGPGAPNMALWQIDGASLTAIGSPIVFGKVPLGVAVNSITNRVYAVIAGGDAVRVIDGGTFTALGPDVPIGDAPHGVGVNPTTNRAYVANAVDDTVSAIGVPLSASSVGIRGSKVTVAWSSLFGPSGSDRIGLFQVGAPNSSPLSLRFTNGTVSAGGPGLASGAVVLPIPIGTAVGTYEIRLLSGTSSGTLAVTTISVIVGPIAEDDTYSTGFGIPLNVPASGVLGNDVSGNGPALQAVPVTGPAHGSLVLQSTGAFIYTPQPNFAGNDVFTYRADDGSVQSIVTTVTIQVTSVACGPRPNVQVASAVGGTALQVTVTVGDANGPTQNTLKSLHFDRLDNGTVTIGGQVHPDPFTHMPQPGATTAAFSVQRVTDRSTDDQYRFTVTDACGEWPSFVGGGTKAGF